MRRLAAWVSVLCVLGVIGIGAVRLTLLGREPPSRQAVLAPGNCPMPCFLGIRPGVTSLHDALQILQNSPYIDPNSLSALAPDESPSTFTVNWRHPGEMLSGIQAKAAAGQDIQIRPMDGQDVVGMIIIQIGLPLGGFLPLFGPPPRNGLTYYEGNGLFYVLEYPALGMQYVLWTDCKQGQRIISLTGSTYILQAPDHFISDLNSDTTLDWHGFSSRPFDQMARQYQCPTIEPPLNGWFARLFG